MQWTYHIYINYTTINIKPLLLKNLNLFAVGYLLHLFLVTFQLFEKAYRIKDSMLLGCSVVRDVLMASNRICYNC